MIRFFSRLSAIRPAARIQIILAFLALCLPLLPNRTIHSDSGLSKGKSLPQPNSSSPTLHGEEALTSLKEQGLYSSLQEAMAAAHYKAEWQAQTAVAGLGEAYELKNPAHNLRAYLTPSELRVVPLGDGAPRPWQVGMKLIGYGYGDSLSSITAGEITAKDNRVEIQKSAIGNRQSAITEWYVNTERGIEQGFDIAAAPDGKPKGAPLKLILGLTGSLAARLDEAKQAITLSDCTALLVYSGLEAVDARGRKLAAHIELGSGRVTLVVDDGGAQYPVKIDPLLTQRVRLTASDGVASDEFGETIAMDGDTVVVGAGEATVGGNANQGCAYVFVRNGTTWTQQQKLVASDGGVTDVFGRTVAISGDTVVVGAEFDQTGPNIEQGSAYVFVRSGTIWTQQQKLTAGDAAAADRFGKSVAISGDTLVVGAYQKTIGSNDGQGAAYVFVRNGTIWTQQQKLTASDGAMNDSFGTSVAISGENLVVGATFHQVGANQFQGSAYVFSRSGTTWTEQQKLIASDGVPFDEIGESVAISGDTVVVCASNADIAGNSNQGAAYVFVRSGATWIQQQKLTASDGAPVDVFGFPVAISGDTIVAGAFGDDVGANTDQGSAYVFVRSGGTWTLRQKLTAGDGAQSDLFGVSVAVSGDTVVVGAELDDVGANANQGSAYVFSCGRSNYAQVVASDGAANDFFGASVAVSGDTVVVGSQDDDVTFADQGSAYVFVRNGTNWIFQQKLTASDAAASDFFGDAVAISGDTLVVGASFDNGTFSDQGSAYVFVRSGVTWTQQQKLIAADPGANDQFGATVAISGDTVVVGSPFDDVTFSDQGSAYAFFRAGVTWTQQQKLVASNGAALDQFGFSVAVSGDTVVVGANRDDVGANGNQGSAYVFVRSGVTWSLQQQLFASDGLGADIFGQSVGITGDTLVVGAPGDDVTFTDQGSAYVFVRSGTVWTQQQQLTSIDGAATDNFGQSVAISGDTVVVCAFVDDVGAITDQGSAYVFVRFGTLWAQTQQLVASDGFANDAFGNSVGISGDTVVVGASFDDFGGNTNQGSAYVFFSACNTAPSIVAGSALVRQQGSAATLATLATVTDWQDSPGSLTVTPTSLPSGITLSNLTNTGGTITAFVAAACNASLGAQSITLQVKDSSGATSTTNVAINVNANAAPTLGIYPNTAVSVLGSTTVTPNLPPSDNGGLINLSATSPTFTGVLSIDLNTGIVSISNARPGGTHVVTVTAVDNCGVATTSGFALTVNCQSITVNPSTIPGATAGSAYTQVFTQTGGNAPVVFSLSGTLPTGLSFTAGTATLSGTPTQVGSFPITVTATDTNNCSGSRNYTLVIGGSLLVWNGSASSDWQTAANWTPNAVPTTFSDVLIPTAGVTNQPTISAGSSSINAMTIQSSRVLTINSSLQLTTAADVTSAGTITGAGKLAVSGATLTQNGSVSVASVEFSAGNHSLAGLGAFASGIATILSGANVSLTSNHSVSVLVINSGGSFDATNQTLTLTGAGTPIFNSGNFTATGSTIIYQGAVAQVVTSNIAYQNLTANNAAGLSLAGDTTVNGQLNLMTDLTTGAFTLTMPASGTSTGTGDVIGNVKRTGFVVGTLLSFGNTFNTIRFDSGTVPVDVTVNLVKSTPPGFNTGTVSRTYTITPNGGSGYTATLRLRYKDSELNGLSEASLELWRYNGSSWASPAGSASRDTSQNWVEETGISAFSPWAIAGPSGPTEVTLISFDATGYDSGVLLEWRTGYETNNLGFNVYRDNGDRREAVNGRLIAGSALKAGSALGAGQAYAWWDKGIAGAYWLEAIDLNGSSTLHGPYYAVQAIGKQPSGIQQARTLAELSLTETASTPQQRLASLLSSNASTAAAKQVQAIIAASPNTLKLQVKSEAWYRVTSQELLAAGLVPSVDPRNLQFFVDGKQQAIYVTGQDDGHLDPGDALEFYGTGIESPFSNLRTYFLAAGKQPGLRIQNTERPAHPSPGGSFDFTVERRDRSIYFAALRNGEKENFFGAVIAGDPVNQTLTLNHLAPSAVPATVTVALQGVTESSHVVSVRLNGTDIGQIVFQGQSEGEGSFSVSAELLDEGANQVTLVAVGGSSDISLVDYVSLTYRHSFTADDDLLKLQTGAGEQLTIGGFTSDAIRVFDVTDPYAAQEVIGFVSKQESGGFSVSLVVPGKGQRSLLVLTNDRAARAFKVEPDYSSNLRSPLQGADVLMISRRELFDSAQELKEYRQKQGLSVAVVDIDDIYDEFSFGQKNPLAVKDFIGFATSQWKKPVKYVLFFGDASYDTKNYLGVGDFDLVPTRLIDTTFMETASDDWFADFNNDGIADIAVGRLPVRNAGEAQLIIKKIISYEGSSPAEEALLVSDLNDGVDFEGLSEQLVPLIPRESRITHIKRGQLGDGDARTAVIDAINRGQRIINYAGHGSLNVWRGGLLSSNDALQLQNREHLSVFAIMTCLNGFFQDPSTESLAEALLKSSGGAVAVWASSAMTFAEGQAPMNREFYRQVFLSSHARLGDAAIRAKAATADLEVRRGWILLGDPAMRLR